MRRYLKILFFFCLELLGVNAIFRYVNRGRIKTLMYHSISRDENCLPNANNESDFAHQLCYLKQRYSVMSITQDGQLVGYNPHRVNVLLTFDDGFRDNYTVALPLLVAHGIRGCFFLIADCLAEGNPPAFASKYLKHGCDEETCATITEAQAMEMLSQGMTVGSHGKDHRDYSRMTIDEGIQDAAEAKSIIERQLGCEIGLMALPWGRYRKEQCHLLNKHYRRIFTTDHGFNSPDDILLFRNDVANSLHLYAAASGSLDYFAKFLSRWS